MAGRVSAALVVVALALATVPAAAGQIKELSLKDGRITLITEEAPLRQILEEWARVGKAEIVNIDRLSGPPLTLQLVDATEREALEILLRSATGYLVTPRLTPDASASVFHRVLVMVPTAPSAAVASSRPVVSAPAPAQPAMPVDDGMAPGFEDPGGRPPETMFNYANPLEYRQQMMDAQGGGMMPGAGDADQGAAGAFGGPAGAATPGSIVQPPQPPVNFRNPYGLPTGVQPGSQPPPPNVQPDRSKYENPG